MYYIKILENELEARSAKNPNFSLRSFARLLKVEPATLSRCLSRKRPLPMPSAQKVVTRLMLSPGQEKLFMESLIQDHLKAKVRSPSVGKQGFPAISQETFEVIAEWYHNAILEMTFIPGAMTSIAKIAGTLGISQVQASTALNRLSHLGFLEKTDSGYRKTNHSQTIANTSLTTKALKKHQKQILQMASQAIDTYDLRDRQATTMCLAASKSKIPQAKVMVTNFLRELTGFLEDGDDRQLYHININLFPIGDLDHKFDQS